MSNKRQGGTKIQTLTIKEHIKKRSMWLGSSAVSPHEAWVMDPKTGYFHQEKLEYSDALYKCIDEVIVNAIDQYINAINLYKEEGGPVTEIRVDFDIETGEVSVMNNGQGMPIYQMDDPQNPGEQVWTVEAIISRPFTGSNFEDEKSPDRVTGGINGLGIKLVNAMSTRFEVETVDAIHNRYYRQVCDDGMNVVNPPEIKSLDDMPRKSKISTPHTTVKFIPNYATLCRKGKKLNPNWYNKKRGEMLNRLIESRVHQLAAFVASTTYRYDRDECITYKRKAKVYFNGENVSLKTLKDYADSFGLCNYFGVDLQTPLSKRRNMSRDEMVAFPWSIVVNVSQAVFDPEDDNVAHDDIEYKKFHQLNIVNGVYLPEGGSHATLLFKMLEEALRKRIEALLKIKPRTPEGKLKSFESGVLKNHLFIFNSIQIPIPQFSGQTKDKITLTKTEINHFKKVYNLPKSFVDKIWGLLKPVLEYKYLVKAGAKKSKKNFVRKYKKASSISKRSKGPKPDLWVPEGDSAQQTINDIITSKKSKLGYVNNGSYNIQGVPMNALKQTKEITVGKHTRLQQTKSLQDNIALQGLVQVLNLDYNYTYYTGPDKYKTKQGDKEFQTLNYGSMIVAVDQDVDGIGHIFGLLITFIAKYWPGLIKRGFVKRFASPLIRVYPTSAKKAVLEFYSLKEFKQWRQAKFGAAGDVEDTGDIPASQYRVKYYKGLATHSKQEVEHMAETYRDNIYTYTWDDYANEYMQIMYGSDTAPRKKELQTPVTAEYDDKLFQKQIVKVSDQFKIETKTFQLEFLERKLPSAVDGMIPSQRKAFCGARRIWATGGKEMKVYQLTGDITKKLHYQHGGASMDETITKMSQCFAGANTIPLLVPISNGFGDRTEGRGKTGQARYIETKLNKRVTDVMFPRVDDWLLEYAYDDGVQCEPKHYVPIVPYAILNTFTTVSVGWKILSWARDFEYTMKQLRNMIKYDYPNNPEKSKPKSFREKVWLQEGMEVKYTKYGPTSKNRTEVCLGDYDYDDTTQTVTITQLPLKVWSYQLRCSMIGLKAFDEKNKTKEWPRKEYVESVEDNTGNNVVDMKVKLVPGALKRIEKHYGTKDLDAIEDYLDLKQNMETQLNFISKTGTVIEFKRYREIIEHWFPIRKQLYIDRLERQILLLKFEIIFYENVQRFILMEKADEINLNDIEPNAQEDALEECDFKRINKALLFAPKYTKASELEDAVFGGTANYDYILDGVSKRMSSSKAIRDRASLIDILKAKLQKLLDSTYKDIWLEELDKLEEIIEEGVRTGWLFGQKQRIFKKVSRSKKK